MLHLIQLELKRIKISKFAFIGGCISMSLYCLIICINGFVDRDAIPFESLDSVFLSLITFTTAITAAFLFCSMVISEYEKKTIHLLFSYPISRKRIIMAKITIVCMFAILMNVGLAIIIQTLSYVLHLFIPIFKEHYSLKIFLGSVVEGLPVMISSGLFIIIPCYFGLRKKSRGLAIGLAIFMNTILASNNSGISLQSFSIVPFILSILALIFAYFGIVNKVEQEDI